MEYSDYNEYCKSLDEAICRCEDEFEKKITYLAAGALGLSFAFISEIVDFHESICLWVLFIGWFLLVVCLIVNLVSQLYSKKCIEKTRRECDENIKAGKSYIPERERIGNKNKVINCVNCMTAASFIVGVVLIFVYVGINLFRC